MNLPNKYIAIDIETTDADSMLGDIIQIGAVVINEDFSMGKQFLVNIKPLTPHRNPEAMKVNGFTEELFEKASDPTYALQDFEYYAFKYAGKRPILAAWANYFDVPFLKEYYKKIERKYPFSYKSLDLKSLAIYEAARRDEDAGGGVEAFVKRVGLEFEGIPHNGLCDIVNSVKILHEYQKRG